MKKVGWLTGAGFCAENGLQTFRGEGGFAAVPVSGHDVERHWIRPDDNGGNWYEGTAEGDHMEGWLCPALLLYFEQAPPPGLPIR